MRKNLLDTISAYDLSAIDYHRSIARLPNYNDAYAFFISLLKSNAKILDLGCGPANISVQIKKALPKIEVTGIDLSTKMIDIAKQDVPDGNFIQTDAIKYRHHEPSDALITGFIFPYLTLSEIDEVFDNTKYNLKINGFFYLSFMDGDKEGYERPSFNRSVQFYIYYHKKETITEKMINNGFEIIKQWTFDYTEIDGSTTKDIVLVGKKK